jgi:hypothetical protein
VFLFIACRLPSHAATDVAVIVWLKMVSKRLMGVWAFFDFTLLAAGAVCIALSIVWRETNVLMNMVLSNADLTGSFYILNIGEDFH